MSARASSFNCDAVAQVQTRARAGNTKETRKEDNCRTGSGVSGARARQRIYLWGALGMRWAKNSPFQPCLSTQLGRGERHPRTPWRNLGLRAKRNGFFAVFFVEFSLCGLFSHIGALGGREGSSPAERGQKPFFLGFFLVWALVWLMFGYSSIVS